uniref:transmembrane protein 134 isoform X3 n=1 Tax=Nyctereutes procyonoides TaxID=34880 RepID=UPI002444207B|nr:transmembrane protein 134 isoform X3 [Nyctereutes procyonoides]
MPSKPETQTDGLPPSAARRRPLGGARAPVLSPKEAPPTAPLGARQLGPAERGRGRYVRAELRPGRRAAALPRLRPGAGPACGGGTVALRASGRGWRRRGAPERAGAMSAARPQFSIDDAFELSLEDAGPGPEFSGVARFGPLHFERRARFEVADEDKQSRLRYQRTSTNSRILSLGDLYRIPVPQTWKPWASAFPWHPKSGASNWASEIPF